MLIHRALARPIIAVARRLHERALEPSIAGDARLSRRCAAPRSQSGRRPTGRSSAGKLCSNARETGNGYSGAEAHRRAAGPVSAAAGALWVPGEADLVSAASYRLRQGIDATGAAARKTPGTPINRACV